MDSNFRYRGAKAADFRSFPGIAGVSAGLLNDITLMSERILQPARLGRFWCGQRSHDVPVGEPDQTPREADDYQTQTQQYRGCQRRLGRNPERSKHDDQRRFSYPG
jgi:hypothetical protein